MLDGALSITVPHFAVVTFWFCLAAAASSLHMLTLRNTIAWFLSDRGWLLAAGVQALRFVLLVAVLVAAARFGGYVPLVGALVANLLTRQWLRWRNNAGAYVR